MTFPNATAAFAYIESFTNFEKTTPLHVREYKLERMELLLQLFDDPHKRFRSIHIAGSKGKGSTGAFLASILTCAGFTTGLYASPHVLSYKERITINGNELPDEVYITWISRIKTTIESEKIASRFSEEGPTTFELLTLLAFLVFREQQCEWAVVETGIGGRLDATNVILPEASVLTPVEREHTDILGETIEQIATEKAGIIKHRIPVFCGYQYEEVTTLFEQTARTRGAPIAFLHDLLHSYAVAKTEDGMAVTYSWADATQTEAVTRLLGDVQAENSALASITARFILRTHIPGVQGDTEEKKNRSIEEYIREGISRTQLSGRMELVRSSPPVILDGAHTPVSVSRLIDAVAKLYPQPPVLLFGSVTGKEIGAMAGTLAPRCRVVIISTPGWFKKSDPSLVYTIFNQYHSDVHLIPQPSEAFAFAQSKARNTARMSAGARDPNPATVSADNAPPILVTGSFYLVSEIKRIL